MKKNNLDKYLKLKKKVELAQTEADQAEGALGEVMKQLKKQFDCNTLKEAKKKLKQLEKQKETSKEEFEEAVEKFEEDWEGEEDEWIPKN